MIISLNEIRTNFDGFNKIIEMDYNLMYSFEEEYIIDMSFLRWIDANMCAPLGAILYKHRINGKNIILKPPNQIFYDKVFSILQKNAFLQDFEICSKKDDIYGTTIQYQRFVRTEKDKFLNYINSHFESGNKGFPQMSEILLKEFRRSLYEIYANAIEHSETKLGIFACGQFYPKKNHLDFTIADLGIGIKERIHRSLGYEFSPVESIEWATSGKTTKMEEKTGGLGFSLIKDFINLNKGRILIISDRGFWEFQQDNVNKKEFDYPFPGTIVTIEINTADVYSYCFESEIDATQIF